MKSLHIFIKLRFRFKSIASAFQSLQAGDSKVIVAGGQENMSMAPHAIHLRTGKN